jgi:hypothetical protein
MAQPGLKDSWKQFVVGISSFWHSFDCLKSARQSEPMLTVSRRAGMAFAPPRAEVLNNGEQPTQKPKGGPRDPDEME